MSKNPFGEIFNVGDNTPDSLFFIFQKKNKMIF